MRNVIVLNEKDIKNIIADYFEIYPQDVEININGESLKDDDRFKISMFVTNILKNKEGDE